MEFPNFRDFIMKRAQLRRAHWMRIQHEVHFNFLENCLRKFDIEGQKPGKLIPLAKRLVELHNDKTMPHFFITDQVMIRHLKRRLDSTGRDVFERLSLAKGIGIIDVPMVPENTTIEMINFAMQKTRSETQDEFSCISQDFDWFKYSIDLFDRRYIEQTADEKERRPPTIIDMEKQISG